METPNVQNSAKPNGQKTAKWVPPRGVRLVTLSSCPQRPYAVQWRTDGKRKTKNFPTVQAQTDFAKAIAGDIKNIGVAALRLDENEARAWRAFRAQIGEGVSLDAVLACWLRHGVARSPLTVREAVAQFLEAKKAEGLTHSALSHYGAVYKRLVAVLGSKNVSAVTREEISEWLGAIVAADSSRRTHFKRAQGFFAWLKTNLIINENPCAGLAPVKIVQEEIEILSVEHGRSLFAENTGNRELLGRLALEAFAGLRFSSATQVVAADIAFDVKGISLPAAKIKTRRRQFIDGLPANLWEWLEWSEPAKWQMTHRQYLEAKSLAFKVAKVPHPHNCLRHSFATYHVAKDKDVSKTAVILCHSSPKMLWSHYKGRATASDGKAWFEISPPKIPLHP